MDAVELIERSDDLSVIEQVLYSAREKDGCNTWVGGAAGMGKTTLLSEACRMGTVRGFRVLEAIGLELERGFPFGVVRQLYEPALKELSQAKREELVQGAATVFGAEAHDGGDPDLSFQALHGLYWLVAELAQRGPTADRGGRRTVGRLPVLAPSALPESSLGGPCRRRGGR